MKDNLVAVKLREASVLIQNLLAEVERLRASENDSKLEVKRLTLRLIASERSKRALDLAESMFKKGMIPKTDVEHKAKEILDYNDDSFAILKEAVDAREYMQERLAFSLDDAPRKSDSNYNRMEDSKKKVEDKLMAIK